MSFQGRLSSKSGLIWSIKYSRNHSSHNRILRILSRSSTSMGMRTLSSLSLEKCLQRHLCVVLRLLHLSNDVVLGAAISQSMLLCRVWSVVTQNLVLWSCSGVLLAAGFKYTTTSGGGFTTSLILISSPAKHFLFNEKRIEVDIAHHF